MFLYCAQVDTWAKEAVEPTDQHVGIQRATDKANGGTHANGAAGVRCKYGAAGLWCKYGAEGLAHSRQGMRVLTGCVPSCNTTHTSTRVHQRRRRLRWTARQPTSGGGSSQNRIR